MRETTILTSKNHNLAAERQMALLCRGDVPQKPVDVVEDVLVEHRDLVDDYELGLAETLGAVFLSIHLRRSVRLEVHRDPEGAVGRGPADQQNRGNSCRGARTEGLAIRLGPGDQSVV